LHFLSFLKVLLNAEMCYERNSDREESSTLLLLIFIAFENHTS